MRISVACAVGVLLLVVAGAGNGGAARRAPEWWLAAVDAAGLTPPGPGKPVLIVDRGLDLSQPELAGRPHTVVLNRQTFLHETDDAFHATALASIIGAQDVGIYPDARIYSWDASPNGTLTGHDVLKGMKVASHYCPGVVLLSLGFSGDYFFYERYLLHEGVDIAVSRGCLVVASAGNERAMGSPPFYPAALPHVLTVAATDRTGGVADFSSASPAIDVAAPGVDIPIAVPLSTHADGYSTGTGTSYAAAIVAGAAAWVWTMRPTLTASQVGEVLRRSARSLGPPGHNDDTGWGMLDVAAALRTQAPPPDPLEPNDDVWYDLPLGLPNAGSHPLTSPRHVDSAIQASVMQIKDPIDVYRVWLPARGAVTARVTPAAGLVLRLWREETPSVLARSADRVGDLLATGTARGALRYRDRSRTGGLVYLEIALAKGVRSVDYTLTVSSRPPGLR